MNMVRDEFDEQLFSRNGSVNWPPRSDDLTPLHYFLWYYVESLLYVDRPNTIEALQDKITRSTRGIQTEILEKGTQNWCFRMNLLKRSRKFKMLMAKVQAMHIKCFIRFPKNASYINNTNSHCMSTRSQYV